MPLNNRTSHVDQVDAVLEYRFPGMTNEVELKLISLAKELAVAEAHSSVLQALVNCFDLDIRDRDNADIWDDEPIIVTRDSFLSKEEPVRTWVRTTREYRDHVENLDERGIYPLYKAATAQIMLRKAAFHEQSDRSRFFSRISADADFVYWLALPSWSLEEATALSLGKDPGVVNSSSLSHAPDGSPFKQSFAERLDRARRCLPKELPNPVAPQSFIKWATAQKFELPEALLQGASGRKTQSEATRLARLQDTYLKLILGMAIAKYGYDVHEPDGSKVYQAIDDDLDRLNLPRDKGAKPLTISADADTVAKHLKEAVYRLKNKWNQ